MSGIASTHTTPRYYGPRPFSLFDLRGIRFANDDGKGGGAGFTPITIETQEAMDELFKERVTRAEKPYEALKGLDIAAVVANYNATKDVDIDTLKAAQQELTTLKANKDADVNTLTAKLAEMETRATTAEGQLQTVTGERDTNASKILRYDAAAKAKLPLEHAARLVGATQEELEADAAEFKKGLRSDGYDPGQGQQDGEPQLGAAGVAEAERRFGKTE